MGRKKQAETAILPVEATKTITEQPVLLMAEPEKPNVYDFSMGIEQKDEDGQINFRSSVSFQLEGDIASKADYIIGTGLDRLFSKMQLAKQFKTKFLNAKLPLYLTINTAEKTLNLGKIDQQLLLKLKVNNGDRSKLRLIDNLIVLVNDMLTSRSAISAIELRENTKIAIEANTGKQLKGGLPVTAMERIKRTELPLTVSANGQLLNA